MIGLSKELPAQSERYELHRLLGTLFSQDLKEFDKLNIIGNEYDIPLEEKFRKDVSVMCNLSQGVEERGIEKGIEKGIEEVKAIIYGGNPDLA